jgi:cyclase
MLKVRVMPTLLYRNFGLVKGVAFDSWRGIGTPLQAIKVYGLREVDELVLLDIAASREGRGPDMTLIDELADDCFMPLTVGGGVSRWEHVRDLLRVGADKVAINSAAVARPGLIQEVAERFGSQCVVASIDAHLGDDGVHRVWTHSGTEPTEWEPAEMAAKLQAAGAGELLITSIDRDGTMKGYDLELIAAVSSAVSIPVIASGGAGSYEDLYRALTDGGATAVAAASLWHFTEATPKDAKAYLRARGVDVRL